MYDCRLFLMGKTDNLFKLERTKDNSIEGKEYLLFWKGERCITKHKTRSAEQKNTCLTNKQNPLIGRESRPFGIEDAPHRHGDSTANCPHKGNHENKIHKSPLARSYVPMHKIAKLPVLVFLLRLRVNYQVPVNVFTFQAPSVSERMLHKYIHAGISPS